jgi:predicted regulator of Ras-like GTPase activity (Roadblock/LC7/MglB family)
MSQKARDMEKWSSEMPEEEIERLLQQGKLAARHGDKLLARALLERVTEQDPMRVEAWLWLAGVAETPEDAEVYLEMVLALSPDNQRAQHGLTWLRSQQTGEPSSPGANGQEESPPAEPAAREAPEPAGQPVESREVFVPPEVPQPVGEIAPSFVLSAAQAQAIDDCLERMAFESEARCIILADMTGQLVSERGQLEGMNTQVLSALAAGELAATNEMARLVGEKARFKLLLHEGEEHSVYLSDVGEQLILVIVFEVTTPIGLVRMILKQAVEDLGPILWQSQENGEAGARPELDGGFARLLEDELDTSWELDT